ncbi:ABC transporter ATP-binding protein [Puia sp.]|jgi:ABC-type multidrug transport system ATPase subunit|uniref:ABC transporter ATP-binding protein n=1 Tax=Puia sp. TaxID=2045100 RepID=UPI002F41959D
MIQLENITKTYNKGQVLAVKDISFTVKPGELFGLIGPDGAGKTTLFRVLTTLLLADKGKATVNGFDVVKDFRQIRNGVGYMPGRFSLYQDLTIEENLQFFATVFGTTIRENYHLIKDIYQQIEPFKERRAGKLSGGMKQKLALCCALIHKPAVLFLDEPTTGVDVVSRKEFWEMLARLKAEGITILVSTPYMDEARLCDRIALIQKGSILSIDTPEGIVRSFPKELYGVQAGNTHLLLREVQAFPGTETCFAFGDALHVTFAPGKEGDVLPWLKEKGLGDARMQRITPGIEDCFIHLLKN